MAATIGGCHLQLKEQLSLAEQSGILEEPFASYLKLEMPLRQTMNANWAKKRHGVDSEMYPECSPCVDCPQYSYYSEFHWSSKDRLQTSTHQIANSGEVGVDTIPSPIFPSPHVDLIL